MMQSICETSMGNVPDNFDSKIGNFLMHHAAMRSNESICQRPERVHQLTPPNPETRYDGVRMLACPLLTTTLERESHVHRTMSDSWKIFATPFIKTPRLASISSAAGCLLSQRDRSHCPRRHLLHDLRLSFKKDRRIASHLHKKYTRNDSPPVYPFHCTTQPLSPGSADAYQHEQHGGHCQPRSL